MSTEQPLGVLEAAVDGRDPSYADRAADSELVSELLVVFEW